MTEKILQVELKECSSRKVNDFRYKQIVQHSQKVQGSPLLIDENTKQLLAAQNEEFMFFGFYCLNGQLKLVNKLFHKHEDMITCLAFLKQTNKVISGSCDGEIKIWWKTKNQQWSLLKSIKAHDEHMENLLANKNEDLVISCSNDQTVKFWNKSLEWNCQQTVSLPKYPWMMSLNEQANTLIVSLRERQILIIRQNNNEWEISQTIPRYEGRQLCFINNEQFLFKPFNKNAQIFEFDNNTNLFKLKNTIKVHKIINQQNDFLIHFNYQKKILAISMNTQCYFIQLENNNNQISEKNFISIGSPFDFQTMSRNGEYFITREAYHSKDISISAPYYLKIFKFVC